MARGALVGEVATRTGVSVRTLHHYDRIGLLRPEGRSPAGYRRYAEADLLRLQQILTLRGLGFSLRRIGELLDRPGFDLAASLRAQRAAVRARIGELERVDAALGALLAERGRSGAWDWDLAAAAVAAAHDGWHAGASEMERLYTPEQLARFAEVAETTPADEIAAIETAWAALLADVRAGAADGLAAGDPSAQALVARWDALTERTTAHYRAHPELLEAVRANYAGDAFAGDDRAPQAADLAFVERARAAGGAG